MGFRNILSPPEHFEPRENSGLVRALTPLIWGYLLWLSEETKVSVVALQVVGGSLDSGPVTANWTSGLFFPSLLGSFLGAALGSDTCLLQPLQPPSLCISQEPGPRGPAAGLCLVSDVCLAGAKRSRLS